MLCSNHLVGAGQNDQVNMDAGGQAQQGELSKFALD